MYKAPKILLIAMPWQDLSWPSIQLGSLKGYLDSKGVSADVRYVNLDLAAALGRDKYLSISGDFSSSYQEIIPVGDLIYAYLLFPGNRDKIKRFLKKNKREWVLGKVTQVEKATDAVFRDIPWQEYDYAGFTTTYIQLFSSIYFAGKAKLAYPRIKIIFGGVSCMGEIGESLMKTFPEIDFVVTGEGERSLWELLGAQGDFSRIPNLVWRRGDRVVMNKIRVQVKDLDNLPPADYSDYFNAVRKYGFGVVRDVVLPYETSRGCWHSPKCYFCNYNYSWTGYRPKSPRKVLQEMGILYRKYKVKYFYLTDSVVNPRIKEICRALQGAAGDIRLAKMHFKLPRDKETLEALLKAGVKHITMGIDALSSGLLKKLGKGTELIEDIQILKWCRELGIKVTYNIITAFPTEEKKDIDQTIRNIEFLKSFKPPHTPLSTYAHLYGSTAYMKPKRFNIKEYFMPSLYRILLPQSICKEIVPYFYELKLTKPKDYTYARLNRKVQEWQRCYREHRPALYYLERGNCLLIIDERQEKRQTYLLKGLNKDLYLFCNDIKTHAQLRERFKVSMKNLKGILNSWIDKRLMFTENNKYLSLAIDIKSQRRKTS